MRQPTTSGKAHPVRVLSAMQPSGQLHLGNYFGSMHPNMEWMGKAESSFYFIVDLHALTTVQNPDDLRRFRRDALLDYLACGLDPEKATVFFQSDVPEHCELAWILSTVTPMGLLERAVSYKEKVEKGIAATVGLFTYPVLMAADILLYDTTVVPVGKDQKQHVEMTRDIAMKFNHTFGETFVIPEPQIQEAVAVVPGTDGQKMSKSYGNTIPLFGAEKAIEKAIMGIVTDSKGPSDPKDPETCTIYRIHKLLLPPKEAETLAEEYRAGIPYGEAKKRLAQTYKDFFAPMRAKRETLLAKPSLLDDIAAQGAAKARAVASRTMERAREATGLSGKAK
ncbi:MAG: tryptophanyl-tRNA synthetase [Candidatus Peregrinibacteria bacterium Gr01-1014_25]|nr:MAG: tryptophanyl-tRNA synthetase [Candidatus Peregrinibacteria bacterium Gr01-1014_25]